MRIVLLGAPGSGKGTQAQFIARKYGIPHISVGSILRSMARNESELGRKIKNIINSGSMVTDELVTNIVEKNLIKIKQNSYRNCFILDGFPRSISQANFMKLANIDINYVVELYIPDRLIIDRVIGRRIHAELETCNIKFNFSRAEDKDNLTKEVLIRREDDQEKIIHQRIIEYHKKTVPVIDFYRKKSTFEKIKYIKLDGTKSIKNLNLELEKILS